MIYICLKIYYIVCVMLSKIRILGVIATGVALAVGVGSYYVYKQLFLQYKDKHNVWLETDLEPDDLIAMKIMKSQGIFFDKIVCGEGNIDKKMHRLIKYFTCKSNSDKKFDLMDSCGGVLKGIGYSTHYVHLIGSDKDFPDNYEYALENYLKNNKRMIILKPPRELYNMYLSNPEKTKSLLKKAECFMYGSFNLRCLKADATQLANFMNLFGKLYLYESYYASKGDNTINKQNYPNFTKLVALMGDDVKDIITEWDNYIVKDCFNTCNEILMREELEELKDLSEYHIKLSDSEAARYHRNYKVYKNISENKEGQFVLADVGLALCMNDETLWENAELSFDSNGYTNAIVRHDDEIMISGKFTNTYIIKNIGFNTLTQLLEKLYK